VSRIGRLFGFFKYCLHVVGALGASAGGLRLTFAARLRLVDLMVVEVLSRYLLRLLEFLSRLRL
jgi:hypothetical protein